MIEIGSARDGVPPELLHAPGGFAWWYADLVTEEGDGVVLIWSYGLPFLPGYADAARRGRAQRPLDRPSANVVVYRRGVPVFYLLQEYPAAGEPESLETEQWIGRSRFARWVAEGRFTLEAELDCALPGTRARLRGTVRVEGTARGAGDDAGSLADAPHVWTPLSGPAWGTAELDVGGRPVPRLRGRAYHDRNGGRVPLHELGIGRWAWGRVPLADRERIYYLLWPRTESPPPFRRPKDAETAPLCLGVDVWADGRTERVVLSAEMAPGGRGMGGVRWPARIVLRAEGRPWLEVRHRRVADDGPFYLRLLSEGRAPGGETAAGWSEICHPDRVDLALHRPLVRMRVHRASGPNSFWLPLFAGPREGRVGRLLRQLLGPWSRVR